MLRYIESMGKKLNSILAGSLMALLPWVAAPASTGGQIQPVDSVRSVVADFITTRTAGYGAPPRIRIGRLGPRLRLPLCSEPLSAFQPPGSRIIGNVTVGVRCGGTSPWTIYVPAHVQIFRPVAVAIRSLERGAVISEADIKLVEHDLAALKLGYIDDARQAIGMVARQRIRAGSVVTPHMVEAPRLIRRGEQVTIVARSGGIEIQAAGTALSDGARGELVRVRNNSSRKIVEAIAAAPGVVEVRTLSHSR